MIHQLVELLDPKPEPKTAFPRCEHRSPAGRQCSQPICATSLHFCFTHKPDPNQKTIAELTEAAGALSTPEEIDAFLRKVTLLRIRGLLTPKEACSYAYLCQILQRGQREIAYHQKLRDERTEREAQESRTREALSWSIPRPDRSDPSDTPTPPINPETALPVAGVSSKSSTAQDHTSAGAGLACPESARRARPSSIAEGTEPTPSKPIQSETTQTLATANEKSSAKKPTRPKPPAPIPPDFYNHFHPLDPTLPPGLQDHRKSIPPPDEAECARRNARRGFAPPRLYRAAASRFFGLWR